MDNSVMPPALQKLQDKFKAYDDRITALESHNRDLLAANQVMREALQKISDMDYGEPDRLKKCKHEKYHWEECEQCIIEVAAAALAINTDDIALVEVASVDAMETGAEWNPLTLDDVKAGSKLYTIQTKSNTE